jgi:Domain of unknown function (DUF3597)
MSIFGSIASAIFGTAKAGTAPAEPGTTTPTTTSATQPTGKPMSRTEVEEMIGKIADEQDEDLNWDDSIVDLLKLLKLDSSLTARKQLAQELGYKGVLDGSAQMNTWLHEQVITKLTEGGGKVPDSLKHV